ncbi:protein lifeguard 1-like isoform X2 [Penaeus japonicus]|uniref:protein lifeguard 1-like isoform X2 n=1 Tax=Penaeus japonicus TaxID=27405 RepID=UPI001C71190C|nr:protein lifeguard 1-like isoform X2 [Penaeus japonicus]
MSVKYLPSSACVPFSLRCMVIVYGGSTVYVRSAFCIFRLNKTMYDPEAGNADFGFSEKSIRLGFIRKVYAILCTQLLITFGMVAIFVWVPSVREYAFNNQWMLWVAICLTFAMVIALSCCGNLRRKSPQNYIALFVFTICEGYLLGVVSASYQGNEVAIAIVATAIVTLGLTLFAFQTKYDFTMMGGMLFVFLIILLIFGITAAIWSNKIVNMVYASLGALLFSFYLVFDTQLMLGGNHKFAISPEEYVFAALNLYLDVVNLFMYILAIVGGSRD